jgi:hypothetical protein
MRYLKDACATQCKSSFECAYLVFLTCSMDLHVAACRNRYGRKAVHLHTGGMEVNDSESSAGRHARSGLRNCCLDLM